MKNWKSITVIFIAALVVAGIVYDYAAIHFGGLDASISHTIIVWAYKYPIITFSVGILCGHLFWRMRDTKETEEITKTVEGEK